MASNQGSSSNSALSTQDIGKPFKKCTLCLLLIDFLTTLTLPVSLTGNEHVTRQHLTIGVDRENVKSPDSPRP